MKLPKRFLIFLGAACALAIGTSGCKSATVEVTIINHGPTLSLVEFDYPEASFGIDTLASGAQYHYRFKIQGSGPLSIQVGETKGKTKTYTGPVVHQGQKGTMTATFPPDQGPVQWSLHLSGASQSQDR